MKLENVQDIYPLTPMQEGMLYHCIAQPDSGAYVDQVIVTLEGSLDLERFVGAFRRVAARFDTLRTAFLWDGVDKPLQIVRDQVEYEVAIVDGRPGDAEARRRQLDELVTTHRVRGFVLEEAPLLRLTLLRQGPAHTDLLLCFHHLILDGWSARTLLQRALREYDGLPSRQPEYRYRDYVEWILGQDQEAARRFWREQLHGFGAQNRLTSGASVSS
ncbi:MAG: condensation domain-containing protein, partial [Planctomycetota bacterium]